MSDPSPQRREGDRRRRRGSVAIALLAALALVLGACSASGEDSSDDATTTTSDGGSTSSTDGATTSEPDDTTTTTEDDGPDPLDEGVVSEVADGLESGLEIDDRATAVCIAAGWVDIVGEDRISDSGADPAALGDGEPDEWSMLDISSSEADALYAVVGDCDHDVIEALFEAFETETDLTDDQLDCLRDLIDDPAIEEALTGTFLGDDGNDTDLASAFETCTGEGG